MCNPAVLSFGVQSAGAVFQHGEQKKQVAARNRAKLANFDAENSAYIREVTLSNASYKDKVIQQEVAIDNIFSQTAEQWQSQDLEMQEVYDKHAFNVQDILIAKAKGAYAGTQTGRTAGRLSAEASRQAGIAFTKSVSSVVLNQNKAQLNKEILTNEANRKNRQQWEQVRQSPIPGHTPLAPELEAGPGIGGLLLNIGMAAAGAYTQHTQMAKMDKMMNQVKTGMMDNRQALAFDTGANNWTSMGNYGAFEPINAWNQQGSPFNVSNSWSPISTPVYSGLGKDPFLNQ